MRILIFGTGAVGGYLGGILTVAGADVTLVARGPHYEAMMGRGLVLEGKKSGRPEPIRVRACRPREEKPPYDLIFVGLKSHQIVTFPPTRRLALAMIEEVFAVASSVGIVPDMAPGETIEYTEKRVDIPSSTLQDMRAGRELQIDAILNAVIDIARLTGVPVPHLEVSAACAGLVNRRIVDDGVAFVPVPVRKPA